MRSFTLALLALLPAHAAAHAFGARYDLPLPLHLWLWTAGATVALSFAVFALVLRGGAGSVSYPRHLLFRRSEFLVVLVRILSFTAFVALLACGFLGSQDPFHNFLPTFVWIAWWIGFTYLTVLVGDVWALVNPWKAVYPPRFGLHRDLPLERCRSRQKSADQLDRFHTAARFDARRNIDSMGSRHAHR